ncbi:ABC transporter permease [Streptomonospora litoralis]|uniref:Teichoic acid translocation permease protein TagG n=1 Tax=Streptomonospora litoralis TaxID=2498135 RepID=A0A4P6Q185_9ACTN|nr:ABC transporter permease [Streptomonospora litoralis]QBI52464.1 Teichoic acid translocation permease protein TagG [Streptomonospora litoralis]
MASRALAVWQNRRVVGLLVRRDLKVKYQSSILGYAWSMLEPLAMAGVYFFVFGLIFDTDRGVPGGGDAPGGYPLFLISGLLPWLWFAQSLSQAPNAIMSHSKLITTMKVPREVFPVQAVAAKFVDYLFTWPVLLVFVFALGGRTTPAGLLVWLPLAVTVQLVFSLGMTLLLASVNVLVRDVERVVRILNRVLFYSSAIIIPSGLVLESDRFPAWFVTLFQCNPLLGIFKMHHAVWYPADAPGAPVLATSIGGAVLMLAAGYLTFRRLETSVLKEL